jgi:ABC-type glutathione transport system ATPase component
VCEMRSIRLEKIFLLHRTMRLTGRPLTSAETFEVRNPGARQLPEIFSGSGGDVCNDNAKDNGFKLVEMRNVSLRLGEKVIFDDLNLAVKKRERFVLMGPSGTGKSTLLKLIVATLRPDSGSVLLHRLCCGMWKTCAGRRCRILKRRFGADLDERLALSLVATRCAMAAAHGRRRKESAYPYRQKCKAR